MDATLAPVMLRPSDRERRAFRARFVAGYVASYSIDTVLLVLFAVHGTVAYWIPAAYFATGSTIGAVFGYLMIFGPADRFRDPYLTFWQTFASGMCMLVFLALAPEVGLLFLGILFIVFGFGSLRMSWSEALFSFAVVASGTGFVLFHSAREIALPYSTPGEKTLVWAAFATILARVILLGIIGSRLRVRAVDAYRHSRALVGELERQKQELARAKTAADVANRAKLESERRLAEQTLQESDERFRQLAETMTEAVLVVQGERNVYANPAAVRLLGAARPEDLIGGDLLAIFEAGRRDRARQGMLRVLEGGELAPFEDRLLRLDGSAVQVECAVSPLAWQGRQALYVVVRDITERKQAEAKLQASLAEKEVLMREVHHRVKNNLQMMSALLELQAREVADATAQAHFKDSQQRIQSMAMIHAQLYRNDDLARVDFASYLQGLVDNLRGQYGDRCRQVNVLVEADPCVLPVDVAVPLGLAVTELVSNAMKHAFPGGRSGELRIALRRAGGKGLVLEVIDDGVGLPAGQDWREARSFGLRLLALMVEQQLHGKVTLDSERGTRASCEIGVPT